MLAGEQVSNQFVIVWNTCVRLGVFLNLFHTALGTPQPAHTPDRIIPTDLLTGILNRRAFYETANSELKKIDST